VHNNIKSAKMSEEAPETYYGYEENLVSHFSLIVTIRIWEC